MKRYEQFEMFDADYGSTNPNIMGIAYRVVVAYDEDAGPFDSGELVALEADGFTVGPGNPVPDKVSIEYTRIGEL